MKDARDYFRLWLLSLEGLTALVGGRVFCDPLPSGTACPAVSYFCKSIPENEGVPLQEVTATVICWGRSEDAARRVFGALSSDILKPGAETARVGDVVLLGLSLEGEETTDQDLEVDDVWWVKCQISFGMEM